MSDLVKTLSSVEEAAMFQRDLAHAAARIEQLEAENARLREALDGISRRYSNGASADTLALIARAALAGKAGSHE